MTSNNTPQKEGGNLVPGGGDWGGRQAKLICIIKTRVIENTLSGFSSKFGEAAAAT